MFMGHMVITIDVWGLPFAIHKSLRMQAFLRLVLAAWLGQIKTVFHTVVNRCEKHGGHEQSARHENGAR